MPLREDEDGLKKKEEVKDQGNIPNRIYDHDTISTYHLSSSSKSPKWNPKLVNNGRGSPFDLKGRKVPPFTLADLRGRVSEKQIMKVQ